MLGWIKLHRKIKDHWLYIDKPFNKMSAWLDILLSANHDDAKVNIGNNLVDVAKGSFITSEVKLSEKWGWSRKTVRSFLQLLEQDEMILKNSTTKYTSITVCNWALYQIEEQQKEQQKNINGTSTEHQRNTNKNDKNDKNDKKKNIVDFSLTENYTEDEELKKTIFDFIEHRKVIKKPFKTQKAFELFLKELDKYPDKISVLNQSIMNGWQGIFEIKKQQNNQQSKPKYADFKQREYSESDYEKFYDNLKTEDL